MNSEYSTKLGFPYPMGLSMRDGAINIVRELYGNQIFISIMNQYTPIRECKYSELNSKVDDSVYDDIIDYAWDIGIRNAFIQEDGSQSESFIPDFDLNSLTE